MVTVSELCSTAFGKLFGRGMWFFKCATVNILIVSLVQIFYDLFFGFCRKSGVFTLADCIKADSGPVAFHLPALDSPQMTNLLLSSAFVLFVSVIAMGMLMRANAVICIKAVRNDQEGWFRNSLSSAFADPLGSAWLLVNVSARVVFFSLFLIVPGIVASLGYLHVWRVKVDNPALSASECIARSAEMMSGKKLTAFLVFLLFLAMQAMLALFDHLAGGILVFALLRLVSSIWESTANTELYEKVK